LEEERDDRENGAKEIEKKKKRKRAREK